MSLKASQLSYSGLSCNEQGTNWKSQDLNHMRFDHITLETAIHVVFITKRCSLGPLKFAFRNDKFCEVAMFLLCEAEQH